LDAAIGQKFRHRSDAMPEISNLAALEPGKNRDVMTHMGRTPASPQVPVTLDHTCRSTP